MPKNNYTSYDFYIAKEILESIRGCYLRMHFADQDYDLNEDEEYMAEAEFFIRVCRTVGVVLDNISVANDV